MLMVSSVIEVTPKQEADSRRFLDLSWNGIKGKGTGSKRKPLNTVTCAH